MLCSAVAAPHAHGRPLQARLAILSSPAATANPLCSLGLRPDPLHTLYPPHMTAAFVAALARFERQLPGFASRWVVGAHVSKWEQGEWHCGTRCGQPRRSLQLCLSGQPNRCPSAALAHPPTCSEDALLHAAETRTSAPLRIDRTAETLESLTLPGLYPCGEGERHHFVFEAVLLHSCGAGNAQLRG